MKLGPRTFLAMLSGWAVPLAGWGLHQSRSPLGNLHDFGVFAFWTGLFVAISWVAVVVPVMTRWGWLPWFCDIRISWLPWSLLGAATYSVLVLLLTIPELLRLAWYPAIVGAVAGIVFALLEPPDGAPDS